MSMYHIASLEQKPVKNVLKQSRKNNFRITIQIVMVLSKINNLNSLFQVKHIIKDKVFKIRIQLSILLVQDL